MMNRKHVAVCIDVFEFQANRILDNEWAKRFPGASWISLAAKLMKDDTDFVTGDIAISHVESGYWKAKDILVIQDLDSYHAKALLSMGAVPFLLGISESPLYAYLVYDKLQKIAPPFINRMAYTGAFPLLGNDANNNFPFYFPSFSADESMETLPWSGRKFCVLVAGNKYWKVNPITYNFRHPRRILRDLRNAFRRKRSPQFITSSNDSLLDERYSLIQFLGQKKLIDLYGAGWNDKARYTKYWWKQLSSLIPEIYKGKASDKYTEISNYKFAVCFENTSYTGYVSEKIMDCFFAGVIPIYLGADDIDKIVPPDIFIDYRKFSSKEELLSFLTNIPEEEALSMIHKAKEYLYRGEGIKFSYQQWCTHLKSLFEKIN